LQVFKATTNIQSKAAEFTEDFATHYLYTEGMMAVINPNYEWMQACITAITNAANPSVFFLHDVSETVRSQYSLPSPPKNAEIG